MASFSYKGKIYEACNLSSGKVHYEVRHEIIPIEQKSLVENSSFEPSLSRIKAVHFSLRKRELKILCINRFRAHLEHNQDKNRVDLIFSMFEFRAIK